MKKNFLVKAFSLVCAVCTLFGIVSVKNVASADTVTNDSAKVIDMYLIAGQSNAAGYTYHNGTLTETFSNIWYAGETDKARINGTAVSSNVSSFDDFNRSVTFGLGRDSERIGPEYGMAEVLNDYYTAENPAFIFKSATGGTSLQDTDAIAGTYGNWYPRSLWEDGFVPNDNDNTGYQYNNFVQNFTTVYDELVRNGYQPKVKGMFWMQGCADYTEPDVYEPILRAFITDIREDLQYITGDVELAYMPFVIGKIATSIAVYNNPQVPAFNEMQQRVANEMPAVETIETADLVIVGPDGSKANGDGWHFGCEDAVTLGQRASNKILEMADSDGITTSTYGRGSVNYTLNGNTVTVTVAPENGYKLHMLTVNGEDVTSSVVNNVYTFEKTAPYVSIIAQFLNDGSISQSYEDENVMDIAEFMSTTAYMSENGVTTPANQEVVFERTWLKELLKRSCGFTFSTKFASNDWQNNFNVLLGGSQVVFDLNGDNTLTLSIYNKSFSTVNIKTSQINNFDATKKHVWKFARVNTADTNDTGYALRIYLDGELAVEMEDTNEVWGAGSAFHSISVNNLTGMEVKLYSALSKKIEFENEKNVYDIVEFDGRTDLYSGEGLTVQNSTQDINGYWWLHEANTFAFNMQGITNYAKLSNGVSWKMKSKNGWNTGANILRLAIGATDIRFGYEENSKVLYVETITKWSQETEHVSDIASKIVLAGNYDTTIWHKFSVVRVAAINARGYLLRFYVDDVLSGEVYTTGELLDKRSNNSGGFDYSVAGLNYNAFRLVNCSGYAMSFRTTLHTRPILQDEACTDIFYHGQSTEILNDNGVVYDNGKSLINTIGGSGATFASDWHEKSDGVAFKMKVAKDWGNGYDKLLINYGATTIRFNSKGNNKITIHVYNYAHDYVYAWGQEYPVDMNFDETQWHTIKITRRKFVNSNGVYGEKGFELAIYIDGKLVLEKVELTGGMWSFANRRLTITNLTGTDMTFKSTISKAEFERNNQFEEENVSELYEMPQHNESLYYEDAFTGLETDTTNRILNSIYTEQFSASTSGAQFILTSKEAWQTSGTQKTLVELTAEELATLTTQDGKEVFKLNGTGELTEVTTTGVNTGKKYKLVLVEWDSGWNKLSAGSGSQYAGEYALSNWTYTPFYKNKNGQLFYSSDTANYPLTPSDLMTKYHLHCDFGTSTISVKQTPDNKLVIRVHSRYSWKVMFEDYARDANGNPIEFRTGTYTGNNAYSYYGQTLNNGDLYQNTFKISRMKEVHNNGFKVQISVNGVLVCEVYDPSVLGGEGIFRHFLIDNLTGTTVKAYSVISYEQYQEKMLDKLNLCYDSTKYSTVNNALINEIIQNTEQLVRKETTIAKVESYVNDAIEQIAKIWTEDLEVKFVKEKIEYNTNLKMFDFTNYDETDAQQIQTLVNEAVEKINAVTQVEGFGKLKLYYDEYYAKLNKILTTAEKDALAQKKQEAKAEVAEFVNACSTDKYTSSNLAKIEEIQSKFEALIDASVNADEVETYINASFAQILAIETKAQTAFNEIRSAAKQSLMDYKKEADYLPLDWSIMLSIIEQGKVDIDLAETETEIANIVTATKAKMNMATEKENKSLNADTSVESGCQSSLGELSLFAIGFSIIVSLRKKKKVGQKNDTK